jgi:hypothetical protein
MAGKIYLKSMYYRHIAMGIQNDLAAYTFRYILTVYTEMIEQKRRQAFNMELK